MIDENGNRNGLPQIPGDAPAFPVNIPGSGDNGWHGMSLRDWFAGQAIGEMIRAERQLSADKEYSEKRIAKWAYDVADAMLATRATLTSGKLGT